MSKEIEKKQMTEDDFRKAINDLVIDGINTFGAGFVLGSLAIVNRFTEVVYDMNTVQNLQNQNKK